MKSQGTIELLVKENVRFYHAYSVKIKTTESAKNKETNEQ
jgi:hypothetical protein